jgi:8-oxo-dGTP pyrophosphatase MutT (NUDIX family)
MINSKPPGGPPDAVSRNDGVMEQISTRAVYANNWLTVREDQVRFPDGTPGIYGVIDKRDFALVIPRGPDGFWMVEQIRYPIGRRILEFPQGSWPTGKSGPPDELARAELREETGLTAGRLTRLGRLLTAPGFCNQAFDVFLAEDLTPGPTERESTEQDMTHHLIGFAEFTARVASGEIADAHSLAAYSLLMLTTGGGTAGR